MARDPAALMVGQYFKRKRELVEIILVAGSGLGITTISVFIKEAIGWAAQLYFTECFYFFYMRVEDML